MNFENILVIGICFVAIAIVAYYFYSKYTSQQNDMNALSKRFETIEMMFTTPPPQKELSDIYNRKYNTPSSNQQPPLRRVSPSGGAAAGRRNLPDPKGPRSGSAHWGESEAARRDLHPHMEPLVPSCEIGLCDLQPLQLETNATTDDETQIDNKIVDVDDDDKNEDRKV